jgi:type II secretory pathway component PulM
VDKTTGWKVVAVLSAILLILVILVSILPYKNKIKRLRTELDESQAKIVALETELDESHELISRAEETHIWGQALQKELVHRVRQFQDLSLLLEEEGITIIEGVGGSLVVKTSNNTIEIPSH